MRGDQHFRMPNEAECKYYGAKQIPFAHLLHEPRKERVLRQTVLVIQADSDEPLLLDEIKLGPRRTWW